MGAISAWGGGAGKFLREALADINGNVRLVPGIAWWLGWHVFSCFFLSFLALRALVHGGGASLLPSTLQAGPMHRLRQPLAC